MAFNPLASIRAYLQPIMAVVAIMTMFLFVFQFGRGDIFESALGWFAKRDRGSEVVKIFGESVHEGDLSHNREDFEIAQEFLNNFLRFGGAANQARMMQLFSRKIFSTAGTFNTRSAQGLIDVEIWRRTASRMGIVVDDERLREFLNAQLGTDPAKPFWAAGTQFSDIDFVKLMSRGSRSAGGSNRVKDALRTLAILSIAREAVVGSSPEMSFMMPMAAEGAKFSPAPADPTPGEFDEYFTARQTRVSAAIAPVVASAELAAEVAKQPVSNQEIQDLYDRFKNVEPIPGSPSPGFMTPRQYKISWVAARPEIPKALSAPALMQAVRVLAPAGAIGIAGSGPSAAAALFAWADSTTPGRTEIGEEILPGVAFWTWLDPMINPVDRRQMAGKLEPIEHKRIDAAFKTASKNLPATVLASFACPTQGPWSAFALTAGVPELLPRQARLTRAATLAALSASGPGAHLFTTASLAAHPAALPALDTVAKEAASIILDESRKAAFSRVVNSLTEDIRKAATDTAGIGAAKVDPVQAEEQIRSKALTLGLAYHAMLKPADEDGLQSDSAVQPLIAAYRENVEENTPKGSPLDPVRREPDADFGAYIRNNIRSAFQPQEVGSVSASFADSAKPKNLYLFWASAIENPAVRPFDQQATKDLVRAEIIRRRTSDRLREKALKAVAALKAGANNQGMTNDEARKRLVAVEELKGGASQIRFIDSLSAQTRTPAVMANMPVSYTANRIPRSVIKYPRPDSIETLAGLLPGQATVINDIAGSEVFVGLVTSVVAPPAEEFTRAYQGATERKTLGDKDQSYGDLARDRQLRYADRLMRDLRRDATGRELDSDGTVPLAEDIRKRFDRVESENP